MLNMESYKDKLFRKKKYSQSWSKRINRKRPRLKLLNQKKRDLLFNKSKANI